MNDSESVLLTDLYELTMLEVTGRFSAPFLASLADLHFTGAVTRRVLPSGFTTSLLRTRIARTSGQARLRHLRQALAVIHHVREARGQYLWMLHPGGNAQVHEERVLGLDASYWRGAMKPGRPTCSGCCGTRRKPSVWIPIAASRRTRLAYTSSSMSGVRDRIQMGLPSSAQRTV